MPTARIGRLISRLSRWFRAMSAHGPFHDADVLLHDISCPRRDSTLSLMIYSRWRDDYLTMRLWARHAALIWACSPLTICAEPDRLLAFIAAFIYLKQRALSFLILAGDILDKLFDDCRHIIKCHAADAALFRFIKQSWLIRYIRLQSNAIRAPNEYCAVYATSFSRCAAMVLHYYIFLFTDAIFRRFTYLNISGQIAISRILLSLNTASLIRNIISRWARYALIIFIALFVDTHLFT